MMIVIQPIQLTYRMRSIEKLKTRCNSKRRQTKRNQQIVDRIINNENNNNDDADRNTTDLIGDEFQ